jgi:hypothetical protein
MDQAFAIHALPHSGPAQELRRTLLEDPGADPALDVLPAPVLEDHGVDAGPVEEVGEQEAGRSGTHDPDLAALGHMDHYAVVPWWRV